MDKKIENILSLHNTILSNKSILIKESDIQGVDELVYNPATGEGGTIGYGYDGGKRVKGITWNGHNNHLHIGFTNRDVAIAIIDKAHFMGLGTSENPYAKKDPNKKVDTSHSSSSFHYKNFPGTPTVGMAVDITGNKNTITELIKWIDSKYGDGNTSSETTTDTNKSSDKTDDSTPEDGYLSSWADNVGQVLMPKGKSIDVRSIAGLKENINRIKELLK